ncbi:MAG: dihydrodipicolinate synthase family protein, partial [Marinobacterium sp.]|nr:dihydrodipicolinate synthase family protein [Marinobacterium sp.]
MFRGSFVALITPFRDGAVDEAALRKMVNWHIEQGTHGLVPVGTTGESPTLTEAEHKRVIEIVVEEAAGRLPVIAGAGSNNPQEAVEYSQHAQAA